MSVSHREGAWSRKLNRHDNDKILVFPSDLHMFMYIKLLILILLLSIYLCIRVYIYTHIHTYSVRVCFTLVLNILSQFSKKTITMIFKYIVAFTWILPKTPTLGGAKSWTSGFNGGLWGWVEFFFSNNNAFCPMVLEKVAKKKVAKK